jgi:hypothetical protein
LINNEEQSMSRVFFAALCAFMVEQPGRSARPEGPTPEEARGPKYLEMGPSPVEPHPRTALRVEDLVPAQTLVEGAALSKRTYAMAGSVQNEVTLKLLKVLRGEGLAAGG